MTRQGARSFVLAAAVVLAFALLTRPGSAQSSGGAAAQAEAREYFRTGAQAYRRGDFLTAARAFDQAYRLQPKPELRFSAAQAFRRHGEKTNSRATLGAALRYYDEYLGTPNATRVADALDAKHRIQELLATMPAESAEDAQELTSALAETQISVDSPTEGALGSIDGSPPRPVGFTEKVAPGKHVVIITAPGHVGEERTVDLAPGQMKPVNLDLRVAPGQLFVQVDEGAEVVVDGRLVGEAPLGAPITLAPGKHRVVAGKNGYGMVVEDVRLDKGQRSSIDIELGMTGQRIAAWSTLGGAAAAAGVGVVFFALARGQEKRASEIQDEAEAQGRALEVQDALEINDALATRDELRAIGVVAGGVAVVSGTVGLFLFLLDQPKLFQPGAPGEAQGGDPPGRRAGAPGLGLGLLPSSGATTLRLWF